MKKIVYIGLGSNLENPVRQIITATQSLSQIPETALLQASSFYISPPMGPTDQPDFINRVVGLETALAAEPLLDCLQEIERKQFRIRTRHWGPRTIDLDILLYGDQIITSNRLTVPHAGLKDRAFFLYPLAEIAPNLILPGGVYLEELKTACLPCGIQVYEGEIS